MMSRIPARALIAVAAAALLATGCTGRKTRNYVDEEVAGVNERIGNVDRRVGDVESQVEANQSRLDEQSSRLDETSLTAREALDRAIAAGKLAEGKLLYEVVLSDDEVRFGFDRADLGSEAEAALDRFATQLKEANESVFIEIQGHTDSIGSEEYNHGLGEQRAEAVRLHLNRAHGLPLHRMSVISYGESAPVADNGNRAGRARNRRVVLVVLQ